MACVSELNLDHPLLERRSPAYTHATVRRAFIVWLRCGQRNSFRDVCDYYHRLEALEEKLPTDSRASSRHHEFSLFVSNPPTSPYQQELFPNLYSTHLETHHYAQTIQNVYQKAVDISTAKFEENVVSHQDIFDASQVFKSSETKTVYSDTKVSLNTMNYGNKGEEMREAWKIPIEQVTAKETKEIFKTKEDNEFAASINNDKEKEVARVKNQTQLENEYNYNGTTKQEIVETSQMIRNYCKEQQIPLRNFLECFKEYAARCELNNTVNNVGFYIKRKMIYEELKLAVKVHRARSDFVVNERRLEKQEALKVVVSETNVNAVEDSQKSLMNNLTKINRGVLQPLNSTTNDASQKICVKKDNKTIDGNLDENQLGLNKNCIKLLKRDNTDAKMTNIDFSSAHFVKLEVQKCRKI